jgi:hypothetical protein
MHDAGPYVIEEAERLCPAASTWIRRVDTAETFKR